MNLNPHQILNLKTIRDIAEEFNTLPGLDILLEAIEEDVRATLTEVGHDDMATQSCREYIQELVDLYNKFHEGEVVFSGMFNAGRLVFNTAAGKWLGSSRFFDIPK